MRATFIAALLLLGAAVASGERAVAAGDPTGPAAASAPADRGRAFVEARCSGCHATGRDGASPLPAAPPLRQLHRRYPVESLEEAFAEGVVTAHPDMPRFALEADEIRDLIAYLHSIED